MRESKRKTNIERRNELLKNKEGNNCQFNLKSKDRRDNERMFARKTGIS